MTGEWPVSRAAKVLAEAPVSPCPHCGRESKTVRGVCVDCWGVKEPENAIDLRPSPQTEPLFGWSGWLSDWVPLWPVAAAAIAAIGLLVAFALLLR